MRYSCRFQIFRTVTTLSNQHDDVRVGTDKMATIDRDGERCLDYFWHISVDDEAAVDTFTLRRWSPAPVYFVLV
ncbi:hypothetical protein NP493_1401g00025 [Ridgeia piscesae]|uniref:Uncharacterized protein n=1 Tax=Ridgeia piscesae TaxID=27915 RepID=A0AAD9K4E0_RIDPI|nr:hypothetical protein NP493_1401g00025 [Ridgeia piscesae]